MKLAQLILFNFRNFGEREFKFSPHLSIIIGKNSRGKTNLLEAVFFAATGHGFREEKEEELLRFNQEIARVNAAFDNGASKDIFEITVKKTGDKVVKTFFVNKTSKRHDFYQKQMPGLVLFTPDQINIIKGSPHLRRDYFNKLISSFDPTYKKHLTNYEAAIRRRNKILEKHVNVDYLREELKFWNEYLEREAMPITQKRLEYVDFLNGRKKLDSKKFDIEYVKNEFSQKLLEKIFEKERLIRKTLIGPQKDDFRINIDDGEIRKDVHHYGSRSEERLAVFWLKINELNYFENVGRVPILLLDDIFSELDLENKKIVLGLIEKYQTIATTTEGELLKEVKVEKETIKL